jgi:hypothetical protein
VPIWLSRMRKRTRKIFQKLNLIYLLHDGHVLCPHKNRSCTRMAIDPSPMSLFGPFIIFVSFFSQFRNRRLVADLTMKRLLVLISWPLFLCLVALPKSAVRMRTMPSRGCATSRTTRTIRRESSRRLINCWLVWWRS